MAGFVKAISLILAASGLASAKGWTGPNDVFTIEPPFRNYFLIVLENEAIDKVLKDPYMGKTLPSRGRLLTNYRGVTHPSQPNYIAMVSGSLNKVLTDGDYNIDARSIADTLEERGLTWKTYQVRLILCL
jgi:hypothetical protein